MTEETIHSRQNRRIIETAKLRNRRQRDRQQRLLIDGLREVTTAVAAGARLETVFVCASACDDTPVRELLDLLRRRRIEIVLVADDVFGKLAFGARTDAVVAVATRPRRIPDDIELPACPLAVILEGIEKPGNIGAILRTADAAGVSAVIVADGRTDLYNPNCIRASLGTIFTVPVAETTSADALAWARKHRLQLLAARVDADVLYTDVDWARPAALILGAETTGLCDLWQADDVTAVRLPMQGAADSLNVSVTAAVIVYEVLRQRSTR